MVENRLARNHESSSRLLEARHVEVDLLVHRVPPRSVVGRVAAIVRLRVARQDHAGGDGGASDGASSDHASGHRGRSWAGVSATACELVGRLPAPLDGRSKSKRGRWTRFRLQSSVH